MGKIEEGAALTDSSISNAEVLDYLEGRYPKQMAESPTIEEIYPSDDSDYSLRRGIQEAQTLARKIRSPRGVYRTVSGVSKRRLGRSPWGVYKKS